MNGKVALCNKMKLAIEPYLDNVRKSYPNDSKMLEESRQIISVLINRVDQVSEITQMNEIGLNLVDGKYFELMKFYYPEAVISEKFIRRRIVPYIYVINE